MTAQQQFWLPLAKALNRITFETAAPFPGVTITGAVRIQTGGVVDPAGRYILRASGGSRTFHPGAGGGWYAYSPEAGLISLSFSGAPSYSGGLVSFLYNSASDLVLYYQVAGNWYSNTLSAPPLRPATDSRGNWNEVSFLLPAGTLQAIEFEGVPSDFAVDNITFGSADAVS